MIKQYLAGNLFEDNDIQAAENMVEMYRERLTSISWFMRCLNEHIARLANGEDKCSGRFWEGRFKSQAILDEAALINTMVYIDLNPIRANIAETPESSAYTSIAERIAQRNLTADINCAFYGKLMPFIDGKGIAGEPFIPMHLADYIELVDWTGRQIRPDKLLFSYTASHFLNSGWPGLVTSDQRERVLRIVSLQSLLPQQTINASQETFSL